MKGNFILTQNQISIQFLVKKLRWKYKDNKEKNAVLNRILWHSLPVVYPKGNKEFTQIADEIEKRKKKKRRAKKYIENILNCYDSAYFATITFSDDVLNSTSENTRKRYVRDFLTENCKDYLANIDYGNKKHREHFHAVCAFKGDLPKWEYGFFNFKVCKHEKTDAKKIATYINKLSNHAGKASAGSCFHPRGIKEVDNLPF